MASMIHCQGVTKTYERRGHRVVALDSVEFSVESGEKVALIGRSGSGKSTLLNLLAGLDVPSSGDIVVHGKSLGQSKAAALARFRAHDIGVVFQSFRLIEHRNAFENIELPLILRGESRIERRRLVAAALEQVGLTQRAHHRPDELSGGEQQRVALARAIVHRPRLLLADEPTGNLDQATSNLILDLLRQLVSAESMTLFVITHDPHVATRLADRQLKLHLGRLVDEVPVDESSRSSHTMKESPSTEPQP